MSTPSTYIASDKSIDELAEIMPSLFKGRDYLRCAADGSTNHEGSDNLVDLLKNTHDNEDAHNKLLIITDDKDGKKALPLLEKIKNLDIQIPTALLINGEIPQELRKKIQLGGHVDVTAEYVHYNQYKTDYTDTYKEEAIRQFAERRDLPATDKHITIDNEHTGKHADKHIIIYDENRDLSMQTLKRYREELEHGGYSNVEYYNSTDGGLIKRLDQLKQEGGLEDAVLLTSYIHDSLPPLGLNLLTYFEHTTDYNRQFPILMFQRDDGHEDATEKHEKHGIIDHFQPTDANLLDGIETAINNHAKRFKKETSKSQTPDGTASVVEGVQGLHPDRKEGPSIGGPDKSNTNTSS